jgi:hypothetical protein
VQEAEESATETETESLGNLRLVLQRRVVELELFERIAQRLILVRLDREQAGEDLRLDFLESRERRSGRFCRMRERVPDAGCL